MAAYATADDLAVYGLPPDALVDIPTAVQEQHLSAASKTADRWLDFLGGYNVPLSAWGEDLRQAVCEIAAYSLLSGTRGYNPEGSDALIKTRAEDAKKRIQILALDGAPDLVDGP